MPSEEIVGGKWWKIDFHLHTPGSYDYGHGDEKQKNTSPENFLLACMGKRLDCIVVSDHDTFRWIPKLREALELLRNRKDKEFREITIFPGIEINVQGNVHLLGIFDPQKDYEELVRLLGQIEINEDTQTTNKSLNQVMNVIIQGGGIAIPAHVDGPSGLFRASASIIKSALRVPGLLALEVLNNDFHNELYNESKLHLTYVLGSDSHETDTIGNRFTWVKMGVPNIEALRLALYDSKDGAIRSIDQDSDPNNIVGRTYIKELCIENGKCIGRKEPFIIKFSPWLNCLIGGRGSGKSTILRFLRLILERQGELPEALEKDFQDFARVAENRNALGLLLNNTRITITMVVDGVPHKLVWKNNEIKEDIDGVLCVADSLNERFPVKMFSQKQLYEMTRRPQLLFDFMDEEWNASEWKERVNYAKSEYGKCQSRLRDLKAKEDYRKKLLIRQRDIEGKIAVFETNSTRIILQNSHTLNVARQLVNDIYKAYQPLINMSLMFQEYTLPVVPDYSTLDQESKSTVMDWTSSMQILKKEIDVAIEKCQLNLVDFNQFFSKIKLSAMIAENDHEMENVLDQLRAAGVDGVERYAELIDQKVEVERLLQDYTDIESEKMQKVEEASKILEDLSNLILERYIKRSEVIYRWSEFDNLKIHLNLFQNIEENEREFRQIIRKESGFDSDILLRDIDTELPKAGFVYQACVNEGEKKECVSVLQKRKEELFSFKDYSKKFKMYMERTIEKYPEVIDDIMTWIPEDSLTLEINMGGHYKPVDAGSPGQRTSAILSLIFGISKMPIIIDQPEDDLDTRNITEIVVEGINRIKSQQQIIVVTHNPNVVVNTNSEQVVQLDYVRGQIETACAGALQNHDVRDAICEVMEGGKDALEKRYYRIFKALASD